VFTTLRDMRGSDIDNRASDGLGGGDNNVAVFRHLEGVEKFAGKRFVKNTHIDCIWY
jgi:hypothetical protein